MRREGSLTLHSSRITPAAHEHGLLDRHNVFDSRNAFFGAVAVVLALLGTVVLFYVNHWIPPVPLALQEGGVYHDVKREDDAFVLRYEQPPWYQPWRTDDDPFILAPGDTVHCFAAVFAPTRLQAKIYHRWQYYREEKDKWVDTDRIGYQVVGGRRNGYRGVTVKRHVHPGAWRVTVETTDRRPIGRIRFDVIPADSTYDPRYTTRRYR